MSEDNGSTKNDDCKGCIHHWLIDSHNLGVCKKCGASLDFSVLRNSYANYRSSYSKPAKTPSNSPITKK